MVYLPLHMGEKSSFLVYYVVLTMPGTAGTAILLHSITIKYTFSDHAKGNSKS